MKESIDGDPHNHSMLVEVVPSIRRGERFGLFGICGGTMVARV